MNVNAKLREGWEPVRADEYPEMAGSIQQLMMVSMQV